MSSNAQSATTSSGFVEALDAIELREEESLQAPKASDLTVYLAGQWPKHERLTIQAALQDRSHIILNPGVAYLTKAIPEADPAKQQEITEDRIVRIATQVQRCDIFIGYASAPGMDPTASLRLGFELGVLQERSGVIVLIQYDPRNYDDSTFVTWLHSMSHLTSKRQGPLLTALDAWTSNEGLQEENNMFGQWLQRLLIRRELSQRELADILDLSSPSYVSRLVAGNRMPSRKTVQDLADRLHLSLGERNYALTLAGHAPRRFEKRETSFASKRKS